MCAIQVLLHPRVVESKVKVVESILHSMQGKSLKKGDFFQDIFPIRDWPKGAVVYIYIQWTKK